MHYRKIVVLVKSSVKTFSALNYFFTWHLEADFSARLLTRILSIYSAHHKLLTGSRFGIKDWRGASSSSTEKKEVSNYWVAESAAATRKPHSNRAILAEVAPLHMLPLL